MAVLSPIKHSSKKEKKNHHWSKLKSSDIIHFYLFIFKKQKTKQNKQALICIRKPNMENINVCQIRVDI